MQIYNLHVEIGKEIKRLRKKKRLSQRALARSSDISSAYIVQLEEGTRKHPSPKILKKLAKHLDVTAEHLMAKAGYIEPKGEYSERAALLRNRASKLSNGDLKKIMDIVEALLEKEERRK